MKKSALSWEMAMIELEKMVKGKLAVGLVMLDKVGHLNFTVTRHPASKHDTNYFHEYHVTMNDNHKKWDMFTYKNGKVEWKCGTI